MGHPDWLEGLDIDSGGNARATLQERKETDLREPGIQFVVSKLKT